MTPEDEIKMLRLEKRAAVLVAENCQLKKQNADLTRMHNADQKYIGKLQAQLRKLPKSLAEQVFKDGKE